MITDPIMNSIHRCSYNESGMSHLITCGLINPDVTPIDEDDVEDDGGEDKDEEGVDHNEIDLFTTDAEKLQAYLEMMRPEVYKERTSSSSSSSCSTSSLLDGISSLKLPQFDELVSRVYCRFLISIFQLFLPTISIAASEVHRVIYSKVFHLLNTI